MLFAQFAQRFNRLLHLVQLWFMLTQGFRDHVVDVTVPPLQERHLAHLSALIFQFLDASELLPENVKKENEALATDNERV